MTDDAQPISDRGVPHGTPVQSSSGAEFGTLGKVLEVDSEDVFDGIIVKTHHGERFVDRDQITDITTEYIKTAIDDSAVGQLPPPSGAGDFHADPLQDEGNTFRDWVGRTFEHRKWTRDS